MIVRIIGRKFVCVAAALLVAAVPMVPHDDAACAIPDRQEKAERLWPMFGGSPGRNMVNAFERDLPADWSIEEGKRKNIKWVAELGNRTIGCPVVVDGKVFVATNNAKPRDPKVQGHKAVMMAFRESDGQFLWQIAHEVADGSIETSPSTPTVSGGNLYYVTPKCEVVCAAADQGTIRWRYDMIKELQVHPHRDYCHEGTPLSWSSPLVVGDHVFAATGNGVDDEGKLVSPKAPSFIALDKRTGKLVWQSNLPSENNVGGHWSSPTFADHGGRSQVIFAGGDGVIYSFVPETGALLWKCDCVPMRDKKAAWEFVGTPVVVGDKLYAGLGVSNGYFKPTRWSYFLCLDISKKGDVSLRNYDAKAVENKKSALVWAFGGPVEPPAKKGLSIYFGRTRSTAAVHDGLVYITEENGYLHCLDASAGKRIWVHDLKGASGSPYLVDGRVYVGTEDGEVVILAHGRAEKVLAKVDMEDMIRTTPVAANGTLYVATSSKLFAIAKR